MKRQPKAGAGRPSRGPREFFATRVPLDMAAEVRSEAERLDLSFSDYIANVLAEKFGMPPVAASPVDDGQMKLTA